jgi:CBS domain-containing protein
MKANQLMTASPRCASTDTSASDVARLMRDCDCGAVPLTDESGKVVGIITDRDLAVRALAEGKSGDTKVGEIMTASPCCASIDDDVREVQKLMADNQVRRIPVVDDHGCCVGIISQADLARAADRDKVSEHEVAVVVEKISEPSAFSRSRPEQQPEQRL